MCPQVSWVDLIYNELTNNTTASDCQTPSGQIPGDEPPAWQRINGYGGKDFEKGEVQG